MTNIEWVNHPTPNLSPRDKEIVAVVLHHSGGHRAGDLSWLCSSRSGVSADFYVDEAGAVYKLNPQVRQHYTWHAGVASLDGITDVNEQTIGIEMEHIPGNPWPFVQVNATARLCERLVKEHITKKRFTSHRQVARPRGRKTDPEGFPWQLFSQQYHAAEEGC